jgi:hypothetical protein
MKKCTVCKKNVDVFSFEDEERGLCEECFYHYQLGFESFSRMLNHLTPLLEDKAKEVKKIDPNWIDKFISAIEGNSGEVRW